MTLDPKSAGVPAGATHVCTNCGAYWGTTHNGWIRDSAGRDDCQCPNKVPIAEAGPAPATAAPAEQLSGKVAESYYGRDCPVGMVQVEFVGCPPEARYSEYGWKPTPHAFLEVWVDGKRFRVDVGDFEDGRARRRGLHIVTDAVGIAFEKTAMNAASIYLEKPDARPAEQPGKAADPRHAQPQAPAEPTQEQIEKATVVVANLWGPKSLHVALVGKIAAALAAEAAPVREERDRLAGELAETKDTLQYTLGRRLAETERANAAEKAVAERDARIVTLERAFRSALDFMDTAVTWLNSSAEIIEDDHKEDAEEVEECREVAKEMHDFILLHRAALGASE